MRILEKITDTLEPLIESLKDFHYEHYTHQRMLICSSILATGIVLGLGGTLLIQSLTDSSKASAEEENASKELKNLLKSFDKVNITEKVEKMDSEELANFKEEFILFTYSKKEEELSYLKTLKKYKKGKGSLPVYIAERKTTKDSMSDLNLREEGIELIHFKREREVNRFVGNIPVEVLPKKLIESPAKETNSLNKKVKKVKK